MPNSPRQELLDLQKRLYKHNERLIESSIIVKESGFEAYEDRYRKNVRNYQQIVSHEEMIQDILKSDIIYVGDYHTCNQSQRSFLRILKNVVTKKKNITIGLELIHHNFQEAIDSYLNGKITDSTFIAKTKLKEQWIFDLWSNFKPLFDFAKYHGLKIVGIDAAGEKASLLQRDKASAKVLVDVLKKNSQTILFVFIGDLHIAPQHLPLEVNKLLKQMNLKKKELILYENSEPIYWKLAENGLDDKTEVVRLAGGNYCRMHTPPIVCQQSYLNWLEHEEGEIDYYDAKSNFLDLVERIAKFLKIKLGPEIDEIEVFTCGDISFLKKLRESKKFNKQELNLIKQQILSSESYYIAKTKYVYLANLSLNHAAEEAAHYLKSLCSGLEEPREYVDAFYANILHETLGFFGSKLINHKRKCFHEAEFKKLLEYLRTIDVPGERSLEKQTAELILEFKKYEKSGIPLLFTNIYRQPMELFLATTHALGYMLGDRLYYAMVDHVVTKAAIKAMFFDPWLESGEPYETYMKLVKKLKGVKIPKRM
ncbi:MAG: ChaN family lipoprotein [Pseudomonadota bacterium]